MADTSLTTYVLLAIPLFVLYKNWSITSSLSHIPTVGSTLPIVSYLQGFKFIKHARTLLQEGYDKYKGGLFKVPMLDQWLVIVTGPQFIDEMRKMPDDHISLPRGLGELLAAGHLFGENVLQDPYHMPLIQAKLNRNLPEFTPLIQEEMFAAMDDLLVPRVTGKGWNEVPVLKVVVDLIARASNRVFVGPTLCRDRELLDISTAFTFDVAKSRFIINMFPPYLKPIVAKLVNAVPSRVKRGVKLLSPVIKDRQEKKHELGADWTDKPNDMLMWLIDYAHTKNYSVDNIVLMLLIVEFSAIHTTAMALTHALYHLAANPEYAQPLREEVEAVLKEEGGWSRAMISKLRKVDSFIRESTRLNGINAISLWRKTLKDITFSDGTVVPKGVFLSAAASSTHTDGEHYTNPQVFDPWRFLSPSSSSEAGGEGQVQSVVSTSVDYIPFGLGKHACPGRFFASFEMKLILAYFVMNYDIKFGGDQEGVRPKNKWIGTTIIPEPTATVMFRKKQD